MTLQLGGAVVSEEDRLRLQELLEEWGRAVEGRRRQQQQQHSLLLDLENRLAERRDKAKAREGENSRASRPCFYLRKNESRGGWGRPSFLSTSGCSWGVE